MFLGAAMSKNQKLCGCGRSHIPNHVKQCYACDADDERTERESRYDVMMLNNVTNIEELKEWIKEHLIK